MERRVSVGLLGLVVCVLLLAAAAGPALGADQVIGRPSITVFSPDNRLAPGEETTLPVYVSNAGTLVQSGPAAYVDRVTTARGLTLEIGAGDAPVTIESGRYPVGSVPEGTKGPIAVAVTVPDDAKPGTYELPVRVQYSYTSIVDYSGQQVEESTSTYNRVQTLSITITDAPQFTLTRAGSDVQVGDTGNVSVTVTNVGGQTARDVDVELASPSPNVRLGGGTADSAHVDRLRPGEHATLTYDVGVGEDVSRRNVTLAGTVSFTDADGIRQTEGGHSIGVEPLPQQRFRIGDVGGELYVGETQSVSFTVTNAGPRPVEAATLLVNGTGVRVTEPEHALGSMAAGEDRRVEIPVAVGSNAKAIPHRLTARVAYETTAGNERESDPIPIVVSVSPERDRLPVAGVRTNVSIDASNELVLSVRNAGDVAFHDVSVRIAPRPPFTSVSPEAYVAELAPGETARLQYELSVSDDAVPSTHGLAVNVSAKEPDGDTYRSDTQNVVVTVTRKRLFQQDWVVVVIGAAVVVLVLAAGFVYTRVR